MVNITKQELISFEEEIARCFNNKMIRAPIHLYFGNEDELINIFKPQKDDWLCCTWRSHYQCLLKGVPPEELKKRILDGKSMVMCIKEYNIICSSIVGGIPSIAVGIAWGLKRDNSPNRVWCFIGDMSAETGAFHEAHKYSIRNNLPITWVIEDNGKSVETPTKKAWGAENGNFVQLIRYQYTNNKYPHAGSGIRINF